MPKAKHNAVERSPQPAARSTKKMKLLAELSPQSDPRAPLQLKLLLKAAAPVLRRIEADLRERAQVSGSVKQRLEAEHRRACEEKRCADEYLQWLHAFVEQVAAAWVLACVFVRTLEDRGLIEHNRLAGPGAADSLKAFLAIAPSLSERDYIQLCLRELLHLPAADALFGEHDNPLWLLAPSAEGARALLELFRTPNADTPALRFGQADTRFLGDLYQDLNENVRARYALLQTPDFVVDYMLDRTLEPAIERFGLDHADVIDPTCGSGHFLLAAFDRLYERHHRVAPNELSSVIGQRALASVFGTDINPYAVAISRFRLTLAFMRKTGITRLKQAPKLTLNVVVADSLLHSERDAQIGLGGKIVGERWFALEHASEAHALLNRKASFAAVIGNPPYITVKDEALRELYRKVYTSAAGQYSLGVPFTERFFDLARAEGRVGMITANSFMKREFGRKLIENFLPDIDLDQIINSAGAYIPGHGTPTVLLFGGRRRPRGTTVLAVLGKRGEPSTPDDASHGLVWSSIRDHGDEVGFENEYISVSRIDRQKLEAHPWCLTGGGAEELKTKLEGLATTTLGELVDSIGRSTHTGEDSFYFMPADAATRNHVASKYCVPLVKGEQVRDWSIAQDEQCLFPYDPVTVKPVLPAQREGGQLFWSYRTLLQQRMDYGEKIEERGLKWFEHSMFFPARYTKPLSITFAFVATHNHFVLDRGGKVFNRSAPIIKLPDGATEGDHLALLAYLNSSTACFWMKQVCHNKTNASQKHSTDPARASYEFAGTALEALPVPTLNASQLSSMAQRMLELASLRSEVISSKGVVRILQSPSHEPLAEIWRDAWEKWRGYTDQMCALQEEIDWFVYGLFKLASTPCADDKDLVQNGHLGGRPFERLIGVRQGFTERVTGGDAADVSTRLPPRAWLEREKQLNHTDIAILESPVHKRAWRFSESNVAPSEAMRAYEQSVLETCLLAEVEQVFDATILGRRFVLGEVRKRLPGWDSVVQELDQDTSMFEHQLFSHNAIPYLAVWIYTPTGLEKRRLWEKTWGLQRREDAGDRGTQISVPPEYSQGSRGKTLDFRKAEYWRMRGKLDVPKERFISYPGLESDEDGGPIYGWAGWDHAQRARALVELYQTRKDHESWSPERLIPALAGLHELLPWVKQWHNEPDPQYDGARFGVELASYLAEELRGLSLTEADLLAWRPEAKPRAAKTSETKPKSAAPKPIQRDPRKLRGSNDNSVAKRRRKEAAQ